MSLDSGRDVWETTALVRIEWRLSAKTVTASVIIKTTIIILACVSSVVQFYRRHINTIKYITLELITAIIILRSGWCVPASLKIQICNFVEVNFKRAQECKM